MCACFTSELCTEWGRIARAMRDLGRRNEAAHHLWDFLEHVVTYRTPLYILLQPFIVHKVGTGDRYLIKKYLMIDWPVDLVNSSV